MRTCIKPLQGAGMVCQILAWCLVQKCCEGRYSLRRPVGFTTTGDPVFFTQFSPLRSISSSFLDSSQITFRHGRGMFATERKPFPFRPIVVHCASALYLGGSLGASCSCRSTCSHTRFESS